MNDMRDDVKQRVVVQRHREYLLVDRPTLENITATKEELDALNYHYGFTIREAKIIWFLRGYIPVDLSLIPSIRTHICAMRKKLIDHNLEIKNCWCGVYQLSIVGD